MKKFCSLIVVSIIGCFTLISCNKDNSADLPEGEGSIVLNGDVDLRVNEITRALVPLTDFTGYTIKVADASSTVFENPVPTGGVVDNIPSGTYTVSLSNMPGFTPAFTAPRYAGQKEGVVVKKGEVTPVSFNLTQANAGIRFIYHSSIDQFGIVAATVKQGDKSLDYSTNPNATGYFSPGDVTMSFKIGTRILKVGGKETITRTLAAADMLTMTLSISVDRGSISLVVTVDDSVNNKTETIGFDPIEEPGESGFAIDGMANTTFTVTFGDGTTASLTTDASGKLDFTGHEGKLIKSIKAGSLDVYIGRGTDENVQIKMSDKNTVAFRSADADGYIPIGTYAELTNIRNGLTGKYKQEADIDLMDVGMRSIAYNDAGAATTLFKGEYDGNKRSIRNLKITANSIYSTGLFGANDGTIRNLTIESGSVTVTGGKGSVGGICGLNHNNGLIEFCINKASASNQATCTGGIAGLNRGKVLFCGNTGTMTGNNGYDGGVVGDNQATGQVIGCYNKADQPCNSNSSGGVVGNNSGIVTACYNIGNMNAADNRIRVAGIVGNNSGGTVTACYSVGNVSGNPSYIAGAVHNSAGTSTVKECYWSGAQIIGDSPAGATYEVYYLTDGTTAPNEATTGWPAENATKGWGVYSSTHEGGYYWKNLGTSGMASYPKLWWE